MDLLEHFQMLARYNRIANERLYESCAQLDDGEYRRQRAGSFGTIHALLNHILLADRIWMSRFRHEGRPTPPLSTILYEGFSELRSARQKEDAEIGSFFAGLDPSFFDEILKYTNSRQKECEEAPSIALSHFFNHQTHHRGQIHVMLSQAHVQPPALDLFRLIKP
jgi:uncharacterized damage-inducible protein DinB